MTDRDDHDTVLCANPACRVGETGRCVEGFDLSACPHYGHEAEAAKHQAIGGDETAASEVRDVVILRAADTLSPAVASSVLRSGEARVIAIIGPSDSGKTSLIASVYDLFQLGAIDGTEFSSSQTLHAFEQACHDARAVSRRQEPDTNRTPRGEVRFYHLEVGGARAGERLSIVLGDRAGEEYREAADDVSLVAKFPEIARADSLTVLVDGERLLDAGARHNLKSEITLMLQALLDGNSLRPESRVALVLTKLDAVRTSTHAARAERDFADLLGDVRRLFGEFFAEIEPFQIAASPKTSALPRGTGVPALLSFWLKGTVSLARKTRPVPQPNRAFARLRPVDELAE